MSAGEIATYILMFLAVYVEVFLLVTFFEKRTDLIKSEAKPSALSTYPTVAVIVPCWNEEKTVHGTIESLLALDYPKDKLSIVIVDDGSTDHTWQEILAYEHHPQIRVFHKENGGKHTAVNFGIERTTSEFVSCLDADSFVAPDALKRMIAMFQEKPEAMAVAPSIIIHRPKNFLQKIQKVEYNMGVYVKKMLSFLGAIHVTPGPFSVFRRQEVFGTIGGFRKAHNTEDMEIAYRMQEHHLKIEHCHTAHVYTVAPDTLYKLYRQRLRWIYGFIQNTIDYRRLLFRKKYGNFSFFTLPSGIISIMAAVYLFGSLVYNLGVWIFHKISQVRAVGLHNTYRPLVSVDPFYINTHTIVFVTITLYFFVITALVVGTRMAKQKLNVHILSYMIVYSFIAPFWLMRAIYNSIVAKKPNWR